MVSIGRGGDTTLSMTGAGLTGRLRNALSSVRFLMVASGAAFIVVVNALIGYGVWQHYGEAIETGERSTHNLARMLEEQTLRTFFSIDHFLDEMDIVLSLRPDADTRGAPGVFGYLRKRMAMMPYVSGAVIVDARGRILHHSQEGAPPDVDLTDRSYFAAHRGPVDRGLFIGAPIRSRVRDGSWVIPVSRRMVRPDGGFGGVLVVMVDPAFFTRFFESMRLGDEGAITLARADGTILVRDPGKVAEGDRIPQWDRLEVLLRDHPAGTMTVISPLDGQERIASHRKVPEYGLIVGASRSVDELLADWRRDTAAWSFIMLAMTGAIAWLTGFVVRQHIRREQDQAKLAVASRRIRGILESMVDAVVTIDQRGRIETFNPAAERMFGYREAEVVGQSVGLLMPESFRVDHEHLIAAHDPGSGSRIIGNDREVLAQRRSGETFPINLAVSELRLDDDAKDGPRIFVGAIRDISVRKQKEWELLAAKSQAEMANRAKSEFLANMSHELRTPLNAIIGFSEILDSEFFGKLNERQKSCAKDIHDSGKHLLDIVNAVLDMSKIEAGRYELTEELVAPAEAVAQCLTMVRDRAEHAGVELRNAIAEPLPNLVADRRAVKQVVLNLLSNAVKFTPSGGTVTVSAALDEDGSLSVSVADTGIGIPKDAQAHIFEPFRQADSSTSRKYEGTGLGLSISRNFMELHGGSMSCQSEPGAGTIMTIRFPAARIASSDRVV